MYQEKVATDLVKTFYERLNSASSTLADLYSLDAQLVHAVEGHKVAPVKGNIALRKHFERDPLQLTGSVVAITSLKALPASSTSFLVVLVGEIKPRNAEIGTFTQAFIVSKIDNEAAKITSDVFTLLNTEPEVMTPADSEPTAASQPVSSTSKSASLNGSGPTAAATATSSKNSPVTSHSKPVQPQQVPKPAAPTVAPVPTTEKPSSKKNGNDRSAGGKTGNNANGSSKQETGSKARKSESPAAHSSSSPAPTTPSPYSSSSTPQAGKTDVKAENKTEGKTEGKTEDKTESKTESKSEGTPEAKSEAKSEEKSDDAEPKKPKKFTFENVAKASTFTPKVGGAKPNIPQFRPAHAVYPSAGSIGSMGIPAHIPPMQYMQNYPMYPQHMMQGPPAPMGQFHLSPDANREHSEISSPRFRPH